MPLPSQPLPSQFNSSPHTNGRPSNPSKSPTPSSNLPYIAAAAGAAGLAASAYHHNHHGHHDSGHHDHYDSSHYYHSDQPLPGGSVAQKHRHKGPMSKFVDFFRDPEGVARFEEYTEYIGVCRYCFEPGSSPRDAPRKHKPKRKISNERFGSSTRIDKDSRYWSSDNDRHRRKNKSWVGAGIAGYGLTQVGKSLFGNNHDFDDTYSVQTGRNGSSTSIHQRRHSSPDYKSRVSRGSTSRHSSDLKSSSKIEVELGGHGKSHKHDSRDGRHGSAVVVSHSKRRSRSRSRSRSKDRKSKLTTAAVGAAVGSALLASSSKKKHSSPEKLEKLVLRRRHSRSNSSSSSSSSSGRRKSRSSRQSKAGSGIFGGFFTSPPPKQHSSHKKKKSVSFFSFGNSSSSSSEGLAYGTGSDHSKRKKSTTSKKINSASEANTALLGLGAAIGTLAAAENRNGSKGKRNGTVVAVKDSKNKSQKIYGHEPSKRKQAEILEDGWENVSEDSFSSADSGLAYGHGNRSSDSLSSSSGTDKWSWRWGSKQKKKRSPSPKHDRHYGTVAAVAGAAAAGAALASRNHHDASRDSNNSIPSLQHVHPEPIIDYGYDHRSGPLSQPPLNTSRPAPIPLQQPQPKPAVASSVYTSQAPYEPSYTSPSGPTVFADLRPDRPSRYDTPDDKDRDVMSDKKYRRRDPSPHVVTVEPRGSAVRFDLSEEQKDKSRRSDRKEERRLSKSDKPKRNSRDADDKAEDKERRKSKDSKKDREQGLDRVESERREVEELKRLKREFEQHEESMRRREEEEIREAERQREALYEAEKRKSSKESSSWKEPALAGIAGAAIVSSIAREASSKKSDDRRTRRSDDGRKVYHDDDRDYVKEKRRGEKPSRKDSKDSSGFAGIVGAAITKPAADADVDERRGREQSHPTAKDTREESDSRDVEQARRIAKKTAIHIKRSPSPVVHEDYSTFFAPAEILSKPAGDKERATSPDADNNVASYAVPGVVTAEPKQKFVFTGPDEDIKPDPDRIFPWRIPHLELIIPTPPVSRAPSVVPSVRSASPSNEPKHEKSEPEKSVKPSGKGVTFGKDETREFEVHSADEHHNDYDVHRKTTVESPEASEFSVREPRKDHASSQSSSWKEPALAGIAGAAIAATLARDSPSKKSKDRGDGDSDVERDVRPNKRAVEERPKQMPGQFDDDIDFTATVAAAMDATGFDSKIVEGDPTFRKRTSPPGSQEPPLNRRPISGSVAEFGFDSPGTKGVPSTRGWVAGKLPDTPNAGSQAASVEELDEKLSKKERKKREKTARRASKDVDLPLANDSRTPTRSEDLNDAELEIIEDASKEIPEESVTPSKSKKSKDKKSKRDSKSAETMIETKDEFHDAEEPSRAALASTRERDIPDEAWAVPLPNEDGSLNGTMSATRSEPRTEKSEPDFYDSPNEYAASVASVPMGDDYEDKKKHRKKSKRRSSGFDDTASVVSSPAQFDDSKDKSTDKREKKSGGIFGIFSKAVDDAADKRKAKPAASEPAEDVEETREKKKKHRKSRDGNDVYSLASDSVADLSRVDVEDPDEFREKKKKHRRSRDSSDVYSLASESVADLSRVDTEESGKSRKSKDKSERRKSRHDSRDEGETGRTTRDLPSKVHIQHLF